MKCESCGIPLDNNNRSKLDSRYCVFCQDQNNSELKSREEIREGNIVATMELMGKNREEAERIADDILPTLPRWSKNAPTENNFDDNLSSPEDQRTSVI